MGRIKPFLEGLGLRHKLEYACLGSERNNGICSHGKLPATSLRIFAKDLIGQLKYLSDDSILS